MTSENVTRAMTDCMKKCLLIISFLCLFVTSVHAQDTANSTQHQKKADDSSQSKITPSQNAKDDEEEDSSDKVRIKGGGDEVISEFRINGQLYMIRVTPKKGVPYYLVDSDGDGKLETRWNELAPKLLIPSWVLLRW